MTDQKIEPCPFCKSECSLCCDDTFTFINCDCGYSGPRHRVREPEEAFYDRERLMEETPKAIAAHNRVANPWTPMLDGEGNYKEEFKTGGPVLTRQGLMKWYAAEELFFTCDENGKFLGGSYVEDFYTTRPTHAIQGLEQSEKELQS